MLSQPLILKGTLSIPTKKNVFFKINKESILMH